MTMDMIIRQEARLIMLRELAAQHDGRLNSELLRLALEAYGIAKTRDWVHDELNWLHEIGAVRVQDIQTVRIAALTAKGLDHVERRAAIEGIKKPSLPA